ncbi:response regulator transcription factor [Paracoccus sediminilitoris]|uniref:response regulator transcription factor n=1 Tax=Paracoccus sediminilitoris TaxID=2202419 RepID=UPI002729AFC9|nr:response regulator transcription factor [Paracoccus sediminilitoris]
MRLLIADDHDLVREAIAALLKGQGFADVTGVASLPLAVEAIEAAVDLPFDVILLDYDMPGMDGLAGLNRVMQLAPDAAVALISGAASPTVARQALDVGARGFLPKTLASTSLGMAIRLIASGQVFVPYEFMEQEEDNPIANLTKRETDVLRGLCAGKSNKVMANDLQLAEVTVKLHVKTLCRKLGAVNRTQAALIGKEKLG